MVSTPAPVVASVYQAVGLGPLAYGLTKLKATPGVLESVRVEQRLVEVAELFGAHFQERRLGDGFSDTPA